MNQKVAEQIQTAPKAPGVYIFYKKTKPLYIGKANSLKTRLKSYLKTLDHKTHLLNQEATKLKLIKLSSPIEALIQEARLIKKLKPQLNVYWSDDKNYFYTAFTKDEFPKIYLTHQPRKTSSHGTGQAQHIGPFTDGNAIKLVLKILRRHYPYCTCKSEHLRQCLNSQIDLCPGFCCTKHNLFSGGREKIQYKKNIKTIKDILSGQKQNLLKKITTSSDIWAFENIAEHSSFLEKPADGVLPKSFPAGFRIECYDISNFAGKEAVGAMTVLTNDSHDWQPDKSQFRKFKIRSTATRNDPQMIAEILSRRLNHPEWPYPDLIVIDGGITQYNAAKKALGNRQINLISFAKPNKKIYGSTNLPTIVIERAIKQTHDFVIRYHRFKRDRIRTSC